MFHYYSSLIASSSAIISTTLLLVALTILLVFGLLGGAARSGAILLWGARVAALHELIWDEAGLELLLWHTYPSSHHVSAHHTSHRRRTEHGRRSHELLAVHRAVLKLLLLVPIFSWIGNIAVCLLLHLHLLLELNHVLLLDNHSDAHVGRLIELGKLGDISSISKLLYVLLICELGCFCTPPILLNHIIELFKENEN